jgi:hypothetical protein
MASAGNVCGLVGPELNKRTASAPGAIENRDIVPGYNEVLCHGRTHVP